jgi:hypothetical protein
MTALLRLVVHYSLTPQSGNFHHSQPAHHFFFSFFNTPKLPSFPFNLRVFQRNQQLNNINKNV